MEQDRKRKLVEKPKMGRPLKWTDEKINELAKKLEEWCKEPNAYALVQFCARERLNPTKLYLFAGKHEEFKEALSYAKSSIASRMIENLNSKSGNCHPAFFNKYIRYNDVLLDAFLKEQEKTQVEEMNKRDVRIINFADYKKEKDNVEKV